MTRLDRFLSERGYGSREEVKSVIKKGRVTVDGVPVFDPGKKIADDLKVAVDSEPVSGSRYLYILLYKPSGYLTARTDSHEKTVMSLLGLPENLKLSPVGRLDKDTEGVLLITNDGELNHRLTSPKYHVKKTYYAECAGPFPENAGEILSHPMKFPDFTTAGAEFVRLTKNSCYLTITEGKYHQVKRMLQAVGCPVTYLRRESFGGLYLTGLSKGESRLLSFEEIQTLKERT